MSRNRTVSALIAAALAAVLLPLGMPSASAHTHPSPPDLTAPGVVFIESGYDVQIALIEHRAIGGPHINLIKRVYHLVLNKGSGFVVEPSADIVTTAAVVNPDQRAAKNNAIYNIFKETYAASEPTLVLPSDPLTQQTFNPGVGVINDYSVTARLKACYEELTNDAGGCDIYVTRFFTVYPYVTDQASYGNLDAKLLTSTSSGIAVLHVSGGGSMPAVNLADSDANTYALSIFGFHGVPVVSSTLDSYIAHLDKKGGTVFKAPVDDNSPFAKVTPVVLRAGLQGSPVAGELGQVFGMISATPVAPGQPGHPGGPTLIPTAAIRAVLKSVDVTPAHGLADASYEAAMHKFQNKGYADSIPAFRSALAAYPGHYLARIHLNTALQNVRAGNPGQTVQPSLVSVRQNKSSGLSWWVWALVAVAALLIAAGGWLLLRRRRSPPPQHPDGKAVSGAPPPGPARPATAGPPRPAGKPAQSGSGPGKPAQSGSGPGKPAPVGSAAGKPAQSGSVDSPHRPPGKPTPATRQTDSQPRSPGVPTPVGGASSPPVVRSGGPPSQQASSLRAGQAGRNDPTQLSRTADGDPGRPAAAGAGRQAGGQAPAFCTSCGGRLAPHHHFCGFCGDPVG